MCVYICMFLCTCLCVFVCLCKCTHPFTLHKNEQKHAPFEFLDFVH